MQINFWMSLLILPQGKFHQKIDPKHTMLFKGTIWNEKEDNEKGINEAKVPHQFVITIPTLQRKVKNQLRKICTEVR